MKTQAWMAAAMGLMAWGAVALHGQPGAQVSLASQQKQLDTLTDAVGAANEKLDNVQAQLGGRYAFFWAGDKGQYLVRVDKFKGQLAFLNITGQPKWLTLNLPELPVDAQNSFYQTYVNALSTLKPL